MSDMPSATPEGSLIRYRMGLVQPKLSAAKLAARLGWGTDKVNMAVSGRTRSRRGTKEYHPKDADLVLIAREIGITPEELEQAGRTEAAQRLRDSPQPASPQSGQVIDPADVDRLARALLKYAPEAEVDPLWYMLHATRGDNEPLPFADCVDLVENWVNRVPAKPAQVTLKRA